MSAPSLAYISSISRLYKSTTLTKGLVTELLSEDDWKNVLSILKERNFIEDIPTTFDDAELEIKKRAIDQIYRILNFSSSVKSAHDIVDLYYYYLTLDEFKAIIAGIYNKTKPSGIMFLSKIGESNPSTIEELRSIIRGTTYSSALEYALEKNPKNLSQLESLLDFYFIEKLSAIVDTFKGDWKSAANSIICGYKDYYSASLAVRQKIAIPLTCRILPDVIRDLQSSKIEEVANTLRRTQYARNIELGDAYSALYSLYKIARIDARKSSIYAFMGSPFTPVTALAISELIKLDMEDLIIIINGLKTKMNKEAIKSRLSLEVI
ncbi:V-type ATPase subunit [Acidianus sp. HS-5]|uniref:V0D/AC39 family V-type ATPase subunit n=1 Tax=Acidianus sp. HS-5 TaxID=2886040 RepID=UPI001F4073F8|nr:V-type ATPase subunit [Acidianus sp. HS-5]BDC19184.1 hypothetical protein HS5_20740 [Acidianus sp. HS-5]